MGNTRLTKRTEGYSYRYVELADINKYCEENDIRYWQEIETCELNLKDYMITYLSKDGEVTRHRGCEVVEARLSGINNPVQAYGSSLTYCRRYSLLMALGLATEDDDGASLSEMTKEQAEKYTINFGKHKGKLLIELAKEHDPYIDWLLNNSKDLELLKAIELLTGRTPKTEEEWDERMELDTKLQEIIITKDLDVEAICKYYKVDRITELSNEQVKEIIEKRG